MKVKNKDAYQFEGWAILYKNDMFILERVFRTRRDLIEWANRSWSRHWAYYRRAGKVKAVKVTVTYDAETN